MKKTILLIFALLVSIPFINAQEELALVRDNDQFGYINLAGDLVINPQFPKAGDFSEGLAAAMRSKKWGFIDTSGKWVIEPIYDRVKAFNSGYALVL